MVVGRGGRGGVHVYSWDLFSGPEIAPYTS